MTRGVDPFQSFMSGADKPIRIHFGTLYVNVNLLLTFSLAVERHNIGIATFINLFLLGYITQFIYDFLQTIIVDLSMVVRVIFHGTFYRVLKCEGGQAAVKIRKLKNRKHFPIL